MDDLTHICPFACSRCDTTCPYDCRTVLLQEYSDGSISYREEVCIHECVLPPGVGA